MLNVGSVICHPRAFPYSAIRTTGLAGSIGFRPILRTRLCVHGGGPNNTRLTNEGTHRDPGEHQRQVKDRQVEQAHGDQLVGAVRPVGGDAARLPQQAVHLVKERRAGTLRRRVVSLRCPAFPRGPEGGLIPGERG